MDRGRFCVYSERRGRGICVMSNTQKISAWEREKYGEHGDNLIAEANARLIAAAPDLLTACRATLAHMHDDETDAPTAAQLTEQLTRAIAKAEGSQQ